MSTPEKPRPSLDETLRNIEALLTEHLAPAGYELVYTDPPIPGHRRSCQYDGPPGPACPGCAAVDADLAVARNRAAMLPPPPPGRGWLARALRRLFT